MHMTSKSHAVCSDLAVLIPSRGRAVELAATYRSIRRQALLPAQVVFAVTNESDIVQVDRESGEIDFCYHQSGKTAQLNAGIRKLRPEITLVAIMDDDVELSKEYLRIVRKIFGEHQDLVGLDGHLLANGGVDRQEALDLVNAYDGNSPRSPDSDFAIRWYPSDKGLYGCCMTIRREVFNHIQFDERLPMYSWMDDADIGIRAQRFGKCAYSPNACMAHLAVKSGRDSGIRFGFAQIMNPFYLGSTGVFQWSTVLKNHVLKAVAANLFGVMRRDKSVDRLGRLRGNWIALSNLVKGRIEPELIREIRG
ncbi:glycosyltransferase family 2 protein [Phragmitibacter flavus]|uniref:Glycosyltransferase family 2 protein n=1 Tax=Phragmitibacter flavus TaxID=2576071 RepID=A0A5R8KCB2_9BACT|nr:glycosyltransferase [Phragmitibacter flavus]TLD69942.1 glycosyltransferase family 2 protein [Phragmitibacter flavus]